MVNGSAGRVACPFNADHSAHPRQRCPVAFSLSATFAHERPARRCSMMAASVSCSPWCHSRRPSMNWKPNGATPPVARPCALSTWSAADVRSAVASRSDRGGGPKVKPPRERRPAKRFRVTGNGIPTPSVRRRRTAPRGPGGTFRHHLARSDAAGAALAVPAVTFRPWRPDRREPARGCPAGGAARHWLA